MTRGQGKDLIGKQTICSVCGKPRSSGLFFIDHGKCAEELARGSKRIKKDKQQLADETNRTFRWIMDYLRFQENNREAID